jgi:ribonuclease E
MSSNRMLIDSTHAEETRVVVQRNNRIDEFDFESASRRPLRGNIYLAKVTRVEPSLQAAFVDFGGNRHGFLAFSEIHPDYYQIPVADREALMAEEARFAAQEDEEAEAPAREPREERTSRDDRNGRGRRGRRRRPQAKRAEGGEAISEEGNTEELGADEAQIEGDEQSVSADEHASEQADADAQIHEAEAHEDAETRDTEINDIPAEDRAPERSEPGEEEVVIEQVGGADSNEDEREERKRYQMRRRYKIQEVIKRRQILLVQVVKEERGNKGAALTTYLSLAGRYSVLMPNTSRGGGISRKITSSSDRKRLRELQDELDLPDGMGVILRTAGASQPTEEIRHDFDYLLRVWEQVRETTLQSVAPMLVHEEGSLIKRSLRDLFGKEIDEVIVAGESGYREARDLMKMLMPSQLKSVKQHKDPQPLFARYGVESQLDAMFSNSVTLKSGGYIVINQTEALVAIDVNSGRSTREHNIEDTALKTNLEAADEVARQLRLRDLAGLIVIDFIDMEEHRNNRNVEKRLKDALRNDRARIQVGRISPFGLMEMSRQRMRTGVVESSVVICPTCAGAGHVRSTSSVALSVLRAIEEALLKSAQFHIVIRTKLDVAMYILNQKRASLQAIEARFGVQIIINVDHLLVGTTNYVLERGEPAPEGGMRAIPADDMAVDEDDAADDTADEAEGAQSANGETGESEEASRRRRRRRGRRGRDRDGAPETGERETGANPDDTAGTLEDDGKPEEGTEAAPGEAPRSAEGGLDEQGRRRRRRGRRGGRRNREFGDSGPTTSADGDAGEEVNLTGEAEEVETAPVAEVAEPAAAPRGRGRPRKVVAEEAAPVVVAKDAPAEKPKRGRPKKVVAEVASEAVEEAPVVEAAPVVPAPPAPKPAPAPAPEVVIEPEVEDPTIPKRRGWWSRK